MNISDYLHEIKMCEFTISHYQEKIRRLIFDIACEVIESNNEFLKHENNFFDWIKGIRDSDFENLSYQVDNIIKLFNHSIPTFKGISGRKFELPLELIVEFRDKLI